MNPTIKAPKKVIDHSVCILVLKFAQKDFPLVHNIVPIGIQKFINIRNGIGNCTPFDRDYSNGYIQVISKILDFVCPSITICIFQNGNPVFPSSITCRYGIFGRLGHPKSAFLIKSHIDRFGDIRF